MKFGILYYAGDEVVEVLEMILHVLVASHVNNTHVAGVTVSRAYGPYYALGMSRYCCRLCQCDWAEPIAEAYRQSATSWSLLGCARRRSFFDNVWNESHRSVDEPATQANARGSKLPVCPCLLCNLNMACRAANSV